MKEFRVGKAIRRLYTTKSYVRGFPDKQWVLEYSAAGMRIWERGHRSQARLLPWKFIIGQAFMWSKSECPEPRKIP